MEPLASHLRAMTSNQRAMASNLGGEIGGPLWLFPFQLGLDLVVSFFSWAQLWNISQQMLWEGARSALGLASRWGL